MTDTSKRNKQKPVGRQRMKAMPKPIDPDTIEPWEQQPGETPHAYSMFVFYRDLHPLERSLSKVVEVRNAATPNRKIGVFEVQRLSASWLWVSRVKHWDAKVAKEANARELKAATDARLEHIQLARELQGLGREAVKKVRAALKSKRGGVTAADAVRAVTEGVKLERLIRGESTENVDANVTQTIAQLAQDADAQEAKRKATENAPPVEGVVRDEDL